MTLAIGLLSRLPVGAVLVSPTSATTLFAEDFEGLGNGPLITASDPSVVSSAQPTSHNFGLNIQSTDGSV
jgi:hypothetical protein